MKGRCDVSADSGRRRRRLVSGIAALAAVAALLAGCSSTDGLASKYGSGQGYVSGDGVYKEIKPADRTAAIAFSGPTVDGGTFDSASLAGKVTVVNFWYATCPPCRLEAPGLAALSAELTDIAFVGVNVYDDAAVARTFDEANDITYPSILDVKTGAVQYAFAAAKAVTPNAVPTTLVLDRQGRVAARISGVIRDTANLKTMIETVQAES